MIKLGVICTLSLNLLLADPLGSSLNTMLKHKKKSPGMVNLSGISLNGKSNKFKTHTLKTRSPKAVIGHYDNDNNKPIYKSEANNYLKKATKGKIKDLDLLPRKQRLLVLQDLQKIYKMKHFVGRPKSVVVATVDNINIYKKDADELITNLTKGKIKDFDLLDKKQQYQLIEDIAKYALVKKTAYEEISEDEKNDILKQVWLEKQHRVVTASSDEMLALYEKKKVQILAQNPQANIPPYISLGAQLKNEVIDAKITQSLMKDVNISIIEDSNISDKSIDENHILLNKGE